MSSGTVSRRRAPRWLCIACLACGWVHAAGRESAANLTPTVLFTASTDFTGGFPDPAGYSYPNDPVNQNPYLPAISPGVTLSPPTGGFNNQQVGPLDGITYGPPFGQVPPNTSGTTGWVSIQYTIPTTGRFQLVWEVGNVINCAGEDALATDNIRLNGSLLTSFDSGLPSGYKPVGSVGTSGSLPIVDPNTMMQTGSFDPTSGSAFAWMDVRPKQQGATPIFDPPPPVGNGFAASRLISSVFTAGAGNKLTLDAAFFSNDGSPYADYGIVALRAIPEPSNFFLAAVGALGMVGYAACRGRLGTR